MGNKRISRTGRSAAERLEAEAIDAVTDIRARRRSHYERSGLDSVSLAVHLWAETGHVPGWNNNVDTEVDGDEEDDGGWAA